MPQSRNFLQSQSQMSAHKTGRYVLDVCGFLRGVEGDLVDLHAFFTDHKANIEVMPISSNGMSASGLCSGGFALVDTSKAPVQGNIVVVRYNSQVVVRRLMKKQGLWRLCADEPTQQDMLINKYTTIERIGVVIAAVMQC